MNLHLTLSLHPAYIAKGTEPLKGHLCIPGMYRGEEEITLYLKPLITLHSADVVADGQRFQFAESNGQLATEDALLMIDLTIQNNRITHAAIA